LIPELAPEEFQQLESNILRDGCREPLSLWADGDEQVLIDGHNRHAICQKNNVAYQSTTISDLPDRDSVKLWIEERQLGRRNLTDDQRAVIADSVRERRSDAAKKERAAEAGKVGGNGRPKDSSLSHTLSDKLSDNKPKQDTRVAVSKEARVPRRKLDTIAEVKRKAPELVPRIRAGSMSLADAKRQVRRADLTQSLNSVEAIEAKKLAGIYDVAVIDPPWPMEKIERDERPNQVRFDYPTMSIEAISEEVGNTLLKHLEADSHVFLWTTHRFLPDALALLKGWGLKYVCTFTWHKPGGFQPIGLPQFNCEFALYARKGSPKFLDTKQFFTCFNAPRGKHSEKPEEFYETMRRVTGGRRLDMFNRRKIEGFDGWGKEAAAA
jgi:N6-adenosine-specific RNA methylase IME4